MTARPPGRVTLEALRERLERDERDASASGGATAGVARALRAIGWSGTDLAGASDVAALIVPTIGACVRRHRDLAAMYQGIAETLRRNGPVLDGSLPPTESYLPAAYDVVRRYVGGSGAAGGQGAL